MATNKNTMLPTYQSTYENMQKALEDNTINSPCWVYLTDNNSLVFIHYEKVNGENVLVPHVILMDKLSTIENQVNLVETKVVTVETKVESVDTKVQDIEKNGATVMITVNDINGGEE